MKDDSPYTHVRHFGHGPRAALAIHCSLAHSGVWSGLATALEDDLTITAYDLPSHGKSADWTPDRDQHRMATDMGLDLLDRPMDLIGHSYGATVALRIAAERPEMVRSLTMVEPVYFAAVQGDKADLVQAHYADLGEYDAALSAGDHETAARLFSGQWGNGASWEDIPEPSRKYMIDRIHFVPGGQPFLLRDNAGLLSSGALERMSMPVLLLQGEHAPAIMDAVNAAIADRLSNVRRATIAGAGHMAPISHPQAVADEIRTLLEMA